VRIATGGRCCAAAHTPGPAGQSPRASTATGQWTGAQPALLGMGGRPWARARAGGGGDGTKRGRKNAAKAPGPRRAAGGTVAQFCPCDLSDVAVETDVLAGAMVHFCCCRKSGHCKAGLEGIVKRLGGKVRSSLCSQSQTHLSVACPVPRSCRRPVRALGWPPQAPIEASAGSSAALSETSDVAGRSRRGARRARARRWRRTTAAA